MFSKISYLLLLQQCYFLFCRPNAKKLYPQLVFNNTLCMRVEFMTFLAGRKGLSCQQSFSSHSARVICMRTCSSPLLPGNHSRDKNWDLVISSCSSCPFPSLSRGPETLSSHISARREGRASTANKDTGGLKHWKCWFQGLSD